MFAYFFGDWDPKVPHPSREACLSLELAWWGDMSHWSPQLWDLPCHGYSIGQDDRSNWSKNIQNFFGLKFWAGYSIWILYIWYDMIWYDMIWYMIYDIWYMIYDIWYMIYDIWYMIYDIWYMIWYDIYLNNFLVTFEASRCHPKKMRKAMTNRSKSFRSIYSKLGHKPIIYTQVYIYIHLFNYICIHISIYIYIHMHVYI